MSKKVNLLKFKTAKTLEKYNVIAVKIKVGNGSGWTRLVPEEWIKVRGYAEKGFRNGIVDLEFVKI